MASTLIGRMIYNTLENTAILRVITKSKQLILTTAICFVGRWKSRVLKAIW